MARRTGNAAVGARQFIVMANSVTMPAADGDISLGMACPGDEAVLIGATFTVEAVGVGTGTHTLTIEHGAGAAGVTMVSGTVVVASVGVIGDITNADSVILAPDAQPATVYGTMIQCANVEGGTITTGTTVIAQQLWQL